jgi:hypothetical protein
MFAASLLQGVMGRDASSSFDHSSEIEFGVPPSQLCVTFRDILSKGGPLFYSNNN